MKSMRKTKQTKLRKSKRNEQILLTYQYSFPNTKEHIGAIAQMGERYNGIVEVVGSIPSGSTINFKESPFPAQI